MSDPLEVVFTAAQKAALEASAPLALAMGGKSTIFTVLPTNKPTPYVVLGEDQILEDGDDCTVGAEIFATTHVWARPPTLEANSARRIAALVRDLLNADLNITGFRTVDFEFVDVRYLTDPDQSTHAVISHRYLVEQV